MNRRLFARPWFRNSIALAGPIAAIMSVSPVRADDTEEREMNRFLNSKYTYCDARVLAGFWGQGELETKARIGRKIGWGDFDVLTAELKKARKIAERAPTDYCPHYENGYTYEDAEVLSLLWGERIMKTKVRMARKLVWGDKSVLDDMLKDAWRKNPNE